MNVFMGYNPLVAKQVKVSVWVKEIDGAEPIFPATPKDGDCFIVFDTDDDVLADNPSLKKSYANGSWEDAGGGGDGVSFPTFQRNASGTKWSCDMTYAEVEAVYNKEAYGTPKSDCPCKVVTQTASYWGDMEYLSKSDIDAAIEAGYMSFNPPIPDTLGGGYGVSDMMTFYGDDGIFYKPVL